MTIPSRLHALLIASTAVDLDQRADDRVRTVPGRGIAATLLALACLGLGPGHAQASRLDAPADTVVAQGPEPAVDDDADSALGTVRPGLAWHWEGPARTRSHAMPLDAVPAARSAAAIDYRLWFGDQRTEVGLGFTPRALGRSAAGVAPDAALRETPGMVLAFRHQLSEQSRLSLDTRWPGSGDPLAGQARRMAFDLGLESSPLRGLAKGTLLRAQLNPHSQLMLRLRGGRVGLYLAVRITGAQ